MKDVSNIKKLIKNTRFLLFPNIYTLIVLIAKIMNNNQNKFLLIIKAKYRIAVEP